MNLLKLCVILVFPLFLFGCFIKSDIREVEVTSVPSLKASENSKSIQLKKIVVKMEQGTELGVYQMGAICDWAGIIEWGVGHHFNLDVDSLTDTFNEELEYYSFKTVGNTPDALFEDSSTWKPDILIAGLVEELNINICYPFSEFRAPATVGAKAFLKINWQVYSVLDKTIIHTVTGEGSGESVWNQPIGADFVIRRAFAQATRDLLADKKFREIVSGGGESLR